MKVNDGKSKVEPEWLTKNRERLEKAARILALIEEKKAQRHKCESEIEVLDHEIEKLAEGYQEIADEIDEAMTLTGIKRKRKPVERKPVERKPRDPNAPRRKRGGPSFIDKVIALLYRDGGGYMTETLAEDFGVTPLTASTTLLKCAREQGWVKKEPDGLWHLTDDGEAEMKRRAVAGDGE